MNPWSPFRCLSAWTPSSDLSISDSLLPLYRCPVQSNSLWLYYLDFTLEIFSVSPFINLRMALESNFWFSFRNSHFFPILPCQARRSDFIRHHGSCNLLCTFSSLCSFKFLYSSQIFYIYKKLGVLPEFFDLSPYSNRSLHPVWSPDT